MTGKRRSPILDVLAAYPAFDWLLVLAAAAAWAAWGDHVAMSDASRLAFLEGVALLAGLVLAAATFICTLTYQSTSEQVVRVRQHFGPELRRNWRSIFASVLGAAVLALLGVLALDANGRVATLVGVIALATVAARAFRAHYWLGYTLFMQQVSDEREDPYVVLLPGERDSA